MTNHDETRHGFTLKELFAVTFIIAAILFFCLIPFGRRGGVREAARRAECAHSLKYIVFALHDYHDIHGRFPIACGGTGAGGNENRRSGLVALLPHLDYMYVYEQIVSPARDDRYPPGGPAPWDKTFGPWRQNFHTFICPSASYPGDAYRPTNYAFCIGDVTSNLHEMQELRGAFTPSLGARLRDITDGTANTIAMAEIGSPEDRQMRGQYAINLPDTILTDPGICWRTADRDKQVYSKKVGLHEYGRGYNWADGGAGPGLVNTILPPNGPSCAVGGKEAVDGVYTAGSAHPRGCQVAFADGSVQFVSEDVDVGDSSIAPPKVADFTGQKLPSPYGVWGAFGTISGGEVKDADDLWPMP